MQQPSYQQPFYPPQHLMKRKTVSMAMICFLTALIADFAGFFLIGLAWLQLQGMNGTTALGQIQAVSQLFYPIIGAFILGSFLKTGGFYFLAEQMS